jgi:hypothetical protein
MPEKYISLHVKQNCTYFNILHFNDIFLGQTAASRCGGFPKFRELTSPHLEVVLVVLSCSALFMSPFGRAWD